MFDFYDSYRIVADARTKRGPFNAYQSISFSSSRRCQHQYEKPEIRVRQVEFVRDLNSAHFSGTFAQIPVVQNTSTYFRSCDAIISGIDRLVANEVFIRRISKARIEVPEVLDTHKNIIVVVASSAGESIKQSRPPSISNNNFMKFQTITATYLYSSEFCDVEAGEIRASDMITWSLALSPRFARVAKDVLELRCGCSAWL
ncbi:hypothetical protein EVAR_76697_1 [Eumeta japonica]|uniref:Uncharacterized protein n=1 Tax=Eumeta variegata TaxID=151549 RepID=A0A4C1SW19_EUMVA|nr:hypothetical protein EVAR_76697_1 [Eumeta japonica]